MKDKGSQNCSISSDYPLDESKLMEVLKEANSQISELNEENIRLKQKLETIKIETVRE